MVRVPQAGEVDWDGLSDRGRWILHQVALPTAIGYGHRDVASNAGLRPMHVDQLLAELAAEVATLAEVKAPPSVG